MTAPATRLAALRILLGGYTLWYIGRRRGLFRRVAASDPALFEPVGLARPLSRAVEPAHFGAAMDAMLAVNVLFLLGWRHAVTGPAFGGSLLWVLSYRNSWSMIYHFDNALAMHALVLGMAPAADALSLDARSSGHVPRRPSRRYWWPIALMNAVTTLTYFLAGVAKLKGPLGRRWATGEALRSQIAADGLRKELLGDGAAPLAYRLYGRVRLFQALAIGSLVIEAAAPLVLLDRRLARGWALNAFAMHWGIYGLMKIKFRYQMTGVIFAPFFPLEQAPRLLAAIVRR